ncbi:MAG: S1C family serine protease [Acidimicrobiales bacterium]
MALAAMLVVVAIGAGVGIGHLMWPSSSTNASTEPSQTVPGGLGTGTLPTSGGSFFGQTPFGSGNSPGATRGSGGPSDTAAIAAKADSGLVDINSTFSYQAAAGSGTGIVVTSSGEVLTNNHVVDGATRISVTDIGNGQTYAATVVGYDSTHDIAVIQMKGASGLPTAKFGNSSTLSVSEPVVAIGNAGGVGGTPTAAGGSITALSQAVTASDSLDGTSEHLKGLIRVNADVQPGDSGGSLVNSSGEVIGMDTAGSETFSFQSSSTSGFAIPINQVLTTAKEIEAGHGSSIVHVGSTAFLGVLVSTSQGSTGSSAQGATVAGLVSGGAAAKAGLVKGDVITSFDGRSISSPTALSGLLVPLHPGDRVPMTWVGTSGASQSATVILGSGPPA